MGIRDIAIIYSYLLMSVEFKCSNSSRGPWSPTSTACRDGSAEVARAVARPVELPCATRKAKLTLHEISS